MRRTLVKQRNGVMRSAGPCLASTSAVGVEKRTSRFLVAIMTGLLLVSPAVAQQDKPPPRVLFTNVHVFDGVNERRVENANVLVEGNMITAVSADPIQADGATVIDGGGRTLMPGMIEAHGHVTYASPLPAMLLQQDPNEQAIRSARRAHDYLMAGFTTVRDMGGNSVGVQKALDAGMFPGPRIYSSGPSISQTTGHGDFRTANDGHPYFDGRERAGVAERLGWTKIADGVDEVRRAVRDNLFRGAAQIKIMTGGGVTSFTDPLFAPQYSPEEIKAAVDEATRYGTYVAVHAQTNAGVVAALDAGAISIEHGLILEEETVKRMAEVGAYYNPQAFLALQDVSGNPMFQDPIQQEKNRQVAKGTPQSIEWAKKYKVKFLWGTDVFFGDDAFVNFRQEFAYRDRFFTPIEQMQQVTGINGEVLALSGWKNPYPHGALGVIKEGAYADILLIDGDPTEDIRLLMDSANIDLIMKDGAIYKNTL
jgi:imidazolonepropionase-like amidohydrolase